MPKEGYEWVKVVEATLCYASGNSIFNPHLPLGNEWELKLEDGRIAMRPVRYKPAEKGKRYGRGWYRRRNADDALPAPKRVLMPVKR